MMVARLCPRPLPLLLPSRFPFSTPQTKGGGIGVSDFIKGIGHGVEAHSAKIEQELPELEQLILVRTMKLKMGFPFKHPRMLENQENSFTLSFRGLKSAAKQMEVILTTDLKAVGSAGDIVKVAKGYARNMLIPQTLALPNLKKYVRVVQKQLKTLKSAYPEREVEQVDDSKTEEQKMKDLNSALNRLDTRQVVIRRHVVGETTIRQSVTKSDIVAEVKRQLKVEIHEMNLDMESSLTQLGEHEIHMRLPKNVEVPGGKNALLLKVRIRRK
eukprot:c20828_g2_i1 orf=115-927(+)